MNATEDAAPRCPRWVKILLSLSLAMNLLIFGAMGGVVFSHGHVGGASNKVREMRFSPFTRALSPADRREIGRDLRFRLRARGKNSSQSGAQTASGRSGQARLARVLGTLRAVPFDTAAFQAAVSTQQRIVQRRIALGQRLLIQRIAAMSPKARAHYAKRLEAAFGRGPK